MPRPICEPCQLPMTAKTNDVIVMEFSQHGPYQLWAGDRAECPGCRLTIIVGFGREPFWRPEYGPLPEHEINNALDAGRLVYQFTNAAERDRFMAFDVPDRHRRQGDQVSA